MRMKNPTRAIAKKTKRETRRAANIALWERCRRPTTEADLAEARELASRVMEAIENIKNSIDKDRD